MLENITKKPFKAVNSEAEFLEELEHFKKSENNVSLPVWIGERTDLIESINLSNDLYGGLQKPKSESFGLLLSDCSDFPKLLINDLVEEWITFEEALDLAEKDVDAKVLVVGLYNELDWSKIRQLILCSHYHLRFRIGFLTGRDEHSLFWMVAKQWGIIKPGVQDIGFFSDVDLPSTKPPVKVYSTTHFEKQDIRFILLNQTWRQVLFQGHGKDDNVNLGDFTICGRNDQVAQQAGSLYPRCGYGWPCFKDEAKLIPLNRLRCAQVILSACNSGPLPGLELYDPKYQLLLNAIDGCAQVVVAALSVHDSERPENEIWIDHVARGGTQSITLLNQSLYFQHPHPAFWHIGLPSDSEIEPSNQSELNLSDQDLYRCITRLQSYLISDLLPPNYPLRTRLNKLNHKFNLCLSRTKRYEDRYEAAKWSKSLRADLQSLDYTLVQRIVKCPEDDIMNFGSYYSDRSFLNTKTVKEVPCSCGFPAQEFERQGLVESVLTMRYVYCLHCGDKVVKLDGSPEIECSAPDRISINQSLVIQAQVKCLESGPIHVGLFVPIYLREYTTIEPITKKVKGRSDQTYEVAFTVNFSPNVPAQAYYFTAFAVQNLGLSTYRQHFGIEKC